MSKSICMAFMGAGDAGRRGLIPPALSYNGSCVWYHLLVYILLSLLLALSAVDAGLLLWRTPSALNILLGSRAHCINTVFLGLRDNSLLADLLAMRHEPLVNHVLFAGIPRSVWNTSE